MAMKHILRSPYNYDRDKVSRETSQDFSEDIEFNRGRAVQSSKDECDINVIVKRFGLTGNLPQGVVAPSFADFGDVFDYQTAMNALISAQNSFMQMPASVRSRFGNDPADFVAFCSDEKNIDEMRKMGLAVPAKPVIMEAKAKDIPEPLKEPKGGKQSSKTGADASGSSGGDGKGD